MSILLEQGHDILCGVSWQTFQQPFADLGKWCRGLLTYDRRTVGLHMHWQGHDRVKTIYT
jgi:hypothetical protein